MSYDEQHIRNTLVYARKLEKVFKKVADQVAGFVENPNAKFARSFSFRENPLLSQSVKAIFDNLNGDIEQIILSGMINEWELANNKNDVLVESYVKNLAVLKKKPDWTNHNKSALKVFTKRQVDGISLSERIWEIAEQYQSELEVHVGLGLLNGDSAATVSRRIRENLKDPTSLFRRVRNEIGELEWSKNALNYNPGQGKYRSAFKNAMRLTVTETNMAYRESDHLRWNQLGFVKGYKVELSGSHPVFDICDELKGEYPKEFKFTGWHPQCLCKAIPILMDDEEYDKYEDAILDGTEEEFLKNVKHEVGVPEGFTNWIDKNTERVNGWKSLPYFIQDNFKGGKIEGGLTFRINISINQKS